MRRDAQRRTGRFSFSPLLFVDVEDALGWIHRSLHDPTSLAYLSVQMAEVHPCRVLLDKATVPRAGITDEEIRPS